MSEYSGLNENVILLESSIEISKGSYIIAPSEDDGDCPHMHINCRNWGGKICVQLGNSRYFSHGEWKDKFLNRTMKKKFDLFLRMKCTKDVRLFGNLFKDVLVTNYMYIVASWNRNHSRLFQSRPNLRITDFAQPNYVALDDRFDR